jgi:hypothetical protein
MSFNSNNNKTMLINFTYYLRLNYFRYFNPHIINHYNLINKLITYKSIGLSYYNKYPSASGWYNLDNHLFAQRPQAKKDFVFGSEQQEQIKKQILSDINFLSEKKKNKGNNYIICSETFQSFYVEKDYHIEQNIDELVKCLKKDIFTNELDN